MAAVAFDREAATVCVPVGVELDLGATAKALAADRAARAAAEATGGGVLVSLGGDIAVAGPPPADGWSVRVTDDHAAGPDAPRGRTSPSSRAAWPRRARPSVAGAAAMRSTTTSSTRRPAGRRGDPGAPVVAAGSCVDANLASTAAIVMGADAPGLARPAGPAVAPGGEDGTALVVAGWPADDGGGVP